MKINEEKIIKRNGAKSKTIISYLHTLSKILDEFRDFKLDYFLNNNSENKLTLRGISNELEIDYQILINSIYGQCRFSPANFDKLSTLINKITKKNPHMITFLIARLISDLGVINYFLEFENEQIITNIK